MRAPTLCAFVCALTVWAALALAQPLDRISGNVSTDRSFLSELTNAHTVMRGTY